MGMIAFGGVLSITEDGPDSSATVSATPEVLADAGSPTLMTAVAPYSGAWMETVAAVNGSSGGVFTATGSPPEIRFAPDGDFPALLVGETRTTVGGMAFTWGGRAAVASVVATVQGVRTLPVGFVAGEVAADLSTWVGDDGTPEGVTMVRNAAVSVSRSPDGAALIFPAAAGAILSAGSVAAPQAVRAQFEDGLLAAYAGTQGVSVTAPAGIHRGYAFVSIAGDAALVGVAPDGPTLTWATNSAALTGFTPVPLETAAISGGAFSVHPAILPTLGITTRGVGLAYVGQSLPGGGVRLLAATLVIRDDMTAGDLQALAAGLAYVPQLPDLAILTLANPPASGLSEMNGSGALWQPNTPSPGYQSALAVIDGVVGYRQTQASTALRTRPVAAASAVIGEQLVAVMVARGVTASGDRARIYTGTNSNAVRAEFTALSTGSPSAGTQTDLGSTPPVARVAQAVTKRGDYAVCALSTRVVTDTSALLPAFGSITTGDVTDMFRGGLWRVTPCYGHVDAADGSLYLDPYWPGWAEGARVRYQIDALATVDVSTPGPHAIAAAPGAVVKIATLVPYAPGSYIATDQVTLDRVFGVAANGWLEIQSIDTDTAALTTFLGADVTAKQYNGFRPAQGGDIGVRASGGTPGMFTFLPLNDFVHLDPGEREDVPITYRRTGDIADRTAVIRVLGPIGLGRDLLRGVAPVSGVYTFLEPVPEGAVVEIAFRLTSGTVTPSVSGVSGHTASTAEWHEGGFRAGPGGATALVMTGGGVIAEVYARIRQTPGAAAPVLWLRAAKSGATLTSLDFGFSTAVALPAHPTPSTVPDYPLAEEARWDANIVGTPAAPAVEINTKINEFGVWAFLRRTQSEFDEGAETPPGSGRFPGLPFSQRAAYTLRHVSVEGYGGLLQSTGYRHVVIEDVHLRTTVPAGVIINNTVKGMNVWRGGSGAAQDLLITSAALCLANGLRMHSEDGTAYYDALIALGAYANAGVQEYEGIGIDYSGRYDVSGRIIFQNYWIRWSPDAAMDSKSPSEVWYASVGEKMRWTWRSWDAVVSVAHARQDFAPIDADATGIAKLGSRLGWVASPCGKLRYWRHAKPDGTPLRQSDLRASGGDPTIQTQFDSQRDNAPNSNPNGVYVAVQRPRPSQYPLNLTDVEVQVSSDGGATWAPLAVSMGPNDAIGAFYRRDLPVPPTAGLLRLRARYGQKTGPWAQVAL